MRRAWLACLIVVCACESDPNKTPVAPDDGDIDGSVPDGAGKGGGGSGGKGGSSGKGGSGGSSGKSGSGGSGKSGTGGGGGGNAWIFDDLGPTIVFTAPHPASDPNADDVITAQTLNVRCKVTRSPEEGAASVAPSSVVISLDNPSDKTKQIVAPVNALTSDEYQGTFDLGALPNGPLSFHCTATDQTANTPHARTETLETLLDLGPTIEVMSPQAKVYARKAPVAIEFRVTRSPLKDGDSEDEVAQVSLHVSGVATPVEQSQDTPGVYKSSVDFDDATLFPVPPTSAQLVFSAANKRSPTVALRTKTVDVSIDGEGPTIKVESPAVDNSSSPVRGPVVLRVNVTDPSGIRPSSLVATIESQEHTITTWDAAPPVYSQRFDTRAFSNELTQLKITVTASDTIGNERSTAFILKLDNLPPVLSIDPPSIREIKKDTAFCSTVFDPVGAEVPDDLSRISNIVRFRVQVEDRTNEPRTMTGVPPVLYLAGVNTQSVKLYMQRNNAVPLLIDTNMDGICDEINYDALELADRPRLDELAPVDPIGNAWYPYNPGDKLTVTDEPGCYEPGPSKTTNPPSPSGICDIAQGLTRVIRAPIQGVEPAIYAVSPTKAKSDGECTGKQIALQTTSKDGWICMAARATDKIGNIGISAPIRLCDDEPMINPMGDPPACWSLCNHGKGGTPSDDCKNSAPYNGRDGVYNLSNSCTDGCKIADAQLFDGSKVHISN
jgi:hypothetical protein